MKNLLASLLIFSAVPVLASQEKFVCVGTEPFWNAQVDGNSVTISDPGLQGQKLVITQRSYPAGTPPEFGQMIKAKGNGVEAVLTIRADSKCSDGMSDAEYSHEVWLLKGNGLVVGCCNPKKNN